MATSTDADDIVLTTRGRQRLQARLDQALTRAAELADRIASEPDHGQDVEDHRRVVAEVEVLSRVLARAARVTDVDEDPEIVELGDEVDVEFPDGETETFVLVHPVESSTDEASISVDSPLSNALLGRRPGERVTVQAPAGSYECRIRARRRAH